MPLLTAFEDHPTATNWLVSTDFLLINLKISKAMSIALPLLEVTTYVEAGHLCADHLSMDIYAPGLLVPGLLDAGTFRRQDI